MLPVILLGWITLTIVIQFNSRIGKYLSSKDRLGLLPRWTFFAPTPGNYDLRVLIRHGSASSLTEWAESSASSRLDQYRSFFRGLFNPGKRVEKALFDYVVFLETVRPTVDEVRLTSEYLALLSLAEEAPRPNGATSVQFVLVATNKLLFSRPRVLLISDVHPLTNY
jgi:hypothetical protein